ncbi:START domain, Homeodomain-like, START-like domain protein [Artemisia annua]|uniref:START domain, Homeodomain-like, START-like domain protein n=1 Tax=Artemisia annua TaxID=35608 RepID=A0A2U1P1Z2_ARTAN|nr:START domain, Homeodomain-like, START-like domain protein [Artemisia annua]
MWLILRSSTFSRRAQFSSSCKEKGAGGLELTIHSEGNLIKKSICNILVNAKKRSWTVLNLNADIAMREAGNPGMTDDEGGSLLTVAFHILVYSVPTAKLSFETVATVNTLIKYIVERIKCAVGANDL